MRLKRNRTSKIRLKKFQATKNNEGCLTEGYENEAHVLLAEVWNASGKLQSELYGIRLNYIRNIRINGKYKAVAKENRTVYEVIDTNGDAVELSENDAVCLTGDFPEYKIISIKPERFLRLEVEKL